MSNVHVHLHVKDLEASRRFYELFLGAAPVKVKPGYVKFLPALAPINLALSAESETAAVAKGRSVDHLGFQVETKGLVIDAMNRVKAAGLTVREELGTDCCFANQDKFWVVDPDGVEWEVYHLNYDIEADDPVPAAGCCPPALTRLGKRTQSP